MTPAATHTGQARRLYDARQRVPDQAFVVRAKRFTRRHPTPPDLPAQDGIGSFPAKMAKQNFDVVANIVIARALPIRTGVQVVVSQRSRCEGSKLPRGESSQMEQFAARKLPFALSAIKCRWTASSSMAI